MPCFSPTTGDPMKLMPPCLTKLEGMCKIPQRLGLVQAVATEHWPWKKRLTYLFKLGPKTNGGGGVEAIINQLPGLSLYNSLLYTVHKTDQLTDRLKERQTDRQNIIEFILGLITEYPCMHAPLTVKKCIWDHVPAEIRYLGLFQLSYLGLAWKTTMQQIQILWGIHGLELFVVVVLFCWLTDCNRQSSSISTYDNLFWIKPLELFNFTCIASSLKKEIGQLRTSAPVQNYPLIRTETDHL